jgi:acetyl esterase/lipase
MVHVIVLPGGGYAVHAERTAEPVAEWLGSAGVSASVFRYPLLARHPAPLDAIRAELRTQRARHNGPVGIIGFSAGGHAAGLAAYAPADAVEDRADFVVLGYPVVSMQSATHRASQLNLLGEDASDALRAATSLDVLVDRQAPPSFVWHSVGDTIVPVDHAYLLGAALARHHVPHELHLFEDGDHALGLARGAGNVEQWTELCLRWLRAHGWAP